MWGLFTAFETQNSFNFPWDKRSQKKLARLFSEGGMLGNVRDREKKITTINLTSHRTKNKVEVKISVVHPSNKLYRR